MWMKRIPPGEKVPLKLTPTETKSILTELTCLDSQYEHIIQDTPAGKPVMMTLDDLDDFCGYIAAEANHTRDKQLGRKLNRVFNKCQRLLDTYTDGQDDSITAEKAKQRLAKEIHDVAAGKARTTILFRLKSKVSKPTKFPITVTQHQRFSLLLCTRLKAAIKRRFEAADEGTQIIECTKKELDHMYDEIGQALIYARSPHKQRLIAVQKKVDDILEEIRLEEFAAERPEQRRRPASKSNLLIQLKVVLLEVRPTIWRRIQVQNCTLCALHEHIQLAMGWENCHMHQFIIEGERYGARLPDDFDMEIRDETRISLSDVLPVSGKRFRFRYEYDFGDGWQHEILFEGYPPMDKGKKLPLCVEGERACPPEDIGGPWGYSEYLDALADCDHDRHDEFMEWSGSFNPEEFSAEKATKAMRRGLPAR